MLEQILSLFATAFGAVVEWSSAVFDATGMEGFVVAMVLVVIAVSLILMPIRTGGVGIVQDNFNPNNWKKRKQKTHRSVTKNAAKKP